MMDLMLNIYQTLLIRVKNRSESVPSLSLHPLDVAHERLRQVNKSYSCHLVDFYVHPYHAGKIRNVGA